MLLLVSLRDKVGTDWDAYYEFYRDTTDRIEIGYAFLNNLFSNLALPYNFFLFIINGFSLTLMFFFMKRNSIFLSIGLLIFFSDLFLYYNFSGIRQAIALSITCFSINFAIDRKLFFFILRFFSGLFLYNSNCFYNCLFFTEEKIENTNSDFLFNRFFSVLFLFAINFRVNHFVYT